MKILNIRFFINTFLLISFFLLIGSCGVEENKGIGPVTNVELNGIDSSLIVKGEIIFKKKCVQCHDMDVALTGPALGDVTKKRKAEWIMNMILNTEEMISKDKDAKSLFIKHVTKMIVKDIDGDQARALLEYLRSVTRNINTKT